MRPICLKPSSIALPPPIRPMTCMMPFSASARSMLKGDNRRAALFDRMAERSGIIASLFLSSARAGGEAVDTEGFYRPGNFPDTAARMRKFEACAPGLAVEAVEKLLEGEDRARITHVIVTSCTGFSAPGIDLALVERCGLSPSVERTMVGFMGCYAAINALKLARHIVRSEPGRPRAGGESGTLHPASARDRRHGRDPVLPAVCRWLCRGADLRRPAKAWRWNPSMRRWCPIPAN